MGSAQVAGGFKSWCCSGVVVAPNVLMTNWHCGGPDGYPEAGYWKTDICPDMLIDISWDDDPVSAEFGCKRVLASDKDLDFALIELKPISHTRIAEPVEIAPPVAAGNKVFMVHHPACRQKQISLGTVHAASFPSWQKKSVGVDFTHDCDTEGGSSGAPVFDMDGRLVGLHHRGFDRDPQTCASDRVNKAVHVSRIIEFLQAMNDGPQVKFNMADSGVP
jgi:hypothetical protein